MDLEMPIFENEGGNWDNYWLNKVSPDYQLDKFFPERIKKPLEFDEIDIDDEDWEAEIPEIGRIKLSHWTKQRIAFIENDYTTK